MSTAFSNSIFYDLLFQEQFAPVVTQEILGGSAGSRFRQDALLLDQPIVIFDFETTGLDTKKSRIIEIGAIKYLHQKEIDRISTFVNPQVPIKREITNITGITADMVTDAPLAKTAIPQFHDFLIGCVGFAHNAEFDIGMLFSESHRLGIQLDYTVFCTLKMARQLLKIERRNLDALAKHYGLEFESRHRSIGDIQVTAGVLWNLLAENPQLQTIQDMQPFAELMPSSYK